MEVLDLEKQLSVCSDGLITEFYILSVAKVQTNNYIEVFGFTLVASFKLYIILHSCDGLVLYMYMHVVVYGYSVTSD